MDWWVWSTKKDCTTLNYIEHSLTLYSIIIGCVFIFTFASLVDIPIGTMSSTIEYKICTITAGIKKYKTVIKKRKRNLIK